MNSHNTKKYLRLETFLVFIFINSIYIFSSDLTRIEYPEPLVWYTFDEVVNDSIMDQSGNNLNAGYKGPVGNEPGHVVLKDYDDLILLKEGSVFNGVGSFTLAFRISLRFFDYTSPMRFIENNTSSGDENYNIAFISRRNHFRIFKEKETYTLTYQEISDSSFNDVVFVYNDTLASLYFNGILLEDSIKVLPRSNEVSYTRLGKDLHGAFDEFKYYNSALNSYQVKTVFEADVINPSTPQDLNATAIAYNKISLEWDASFDAVGVAGYEIYRNDTLVGITENTNYVDSGLVTDLTHFYKLRAFDHTGNVSDYSEPDSAHICSTIDVEYLHTTYFICTGDTVTLETLYTDNSYNYQWQVKEQENWLDLTDSEYYKNTNSSELLIQGVTEELTPQTYRLVIENKCETKYLDTVYITQNFKHSVSGMVNTGSNELNLGKVYLFKLGNSGVARVVDSSLVSGGYFYFLNVCQGEYKLKAVPLGSASNIYSERFYENGNNVAEATSLQIDKDIVHVKINLVPSFLDVSNINNSAVSIYPTIVEDEINIISEEFLNADVDVVITNLLGIPVYKHKIQPNETKISLNLSHLFPGFYYITLVLENTVLKTQRIIIK